MEYLVPIVIVTLGIGLLLLFLRRPTVVRPPTILPPAKTDAMAEANSETLQEILGDLTAKMPPGQTKRVTILKGNKQIGWTVTRRLDNTSLSPDDLRKLVGEGSVGKLAGELLETLGTNGVSANVPTESGLQYPGSNLVVSSSEAKQATGGGSPGVRDVHKTTFATEATSDQVLAWYEDWLLAHDWQPASSGDASAASSHQYARGSEYFRLAIGDPATIREILAVPIPDGAKTIYEVEYSNSSPPAGQ
jgi:hypothetical protein